MSPRADAEKKQESALEPWMPGANEDEKGLRRSLAVAFAVHLGLLFVTLPSLYSEPVVEATEPQKVFVVQQTRFKAPPPPPPERPKPRTRRVPIPDPTPDGPEPLRLRDVEPTAVDLDVDDVVFGIPEAPPAPPPDHGGPLEIGGEVAAPVRIHFIKPRYTEIARRARITGSVILETVIDRDGRVTEIKVLKRLGMGLTESAVEAVAQWRFKPSTLNGRPVAVIYRPTVHFEIQ